MRLAVHQARSFFDVWLTATIDASAFMPYDIDHIFFGLYDLWHIAICLGATDLQHVASTHLSHSYLDGGTALNIVPSSET